MTDKSANQKNQAKKELYMQTMEVMAMKDKGFTSLIMKIKNGFNSVNKEAIESVKSETLI